MKSDVPPLELEISDSTSFKNIQDAFNAAYPFLSIDFFLQPASGYGHLEKVKPDMVIKNLCPFAGTKHINIQGTQRVAELEADFWETLGVKINVLRRLGNVWVGTSYTGEWSLEHQNSESQQINMDN